MSSAHPQMLGAFAVAFLISYWTVPARRRRLRASLFLLVLSLLGRLGADALTPGAADHTELYLTVRCAALFLEAVAFINVTSVLVFAAALHALRLEPPRILQDLAVGLAYLLSAGILLSSTGLDIRGVIATSAVISAVIGFSLQDTLGNIMGGLALQIERTVRPGDWIRVDDQEGRVRETRWRQTSIETRDGDTVVIPNSLLMKSKVTLLGQHSGPVVQHRRWVFFNVDFRYPPGEVVGIVEAALQGERFPNVSESPQPHCLLIAYKESYISYAARYWLTDLAVPDPTDSLIRVRIAAALRRADIALSIPAYSLFVHKKNEPQHLRKVQRELEQRLTVLEKLTLLDPLTPPELRTLADRIKWAPFVRGETMTHQGAESDSLFIITKGSATVHMTADGRSRELGTLKEGDFFGEMGVMTGEPRTASVIAETDVECYQLGKAAFEELLRSRPEIAGQISHTLATRRIELEEAEQEATEEARQARHAHTQRAVLQRMRTFFGLSHDDPA